MVCAVCLSICLWTGETMEGGGGGGGGGGLVSCHLTNV